MALAVESVESRPKPVVAARLRYLAVLSLLALSFMIFQIAVLRELRFQLSTIFTLTPFLFSSVIAFIGLGSLFAGRVTWVAERVLTWGAALLPIVLLLAFALTVLVAQSTIDHTSAAFSTYSNQPGTAGDTYIQSVVRGWVAVALLGYGPVFFLQGLIFALYFREGRQDGVLSNVYAADLLASGVGAIVGGLLSFVMNPGHMVLVASGLLLINLWTSVQYLRVPGRLAVAASLLTLVLIAAELTLGVFATLELPWWLGETPAHSRWSRYRRIDVVDVPKELMVFADGLLFQWYRKDDHFHEWDPRALPARLIGQLGDSVRDVLIIGAGTGSDVRIFRDLVSKNLRTVAVELDEGFVKTAQAFPWLWSDYQTAEIVVQEGRYFLENDPRTFDAIVYAYIDPQAAISDIGLPDANFLYTDRGLRRAYAKVRPGGYLMITRVFFVHEQGEFVRRLVATLSAAGIPKTEIAMYRAKETSAWGYYGELSTIHAIITKGGQPPDLTDPRLVRLEWMEGGRATTDLFPISMVTGVWFDRLLQYVKRNTIALVIVVTILLAVVARISTSIGYLSFFLLGFGSFLLESLVLFNSFLLLGDPNLSAALAVGLFLFWSGLGSLYSDRWERSGWLYLLVPLAVLAYAATAPMLNALTISRPLSMRTAVFALHLSLAGIVTGGMFPIALRSFRRERVTSMFFIDIVGCALAPIAFWFALSAAGIWPVATAAVASYTVAGALLAARR